jgi:ATP phosphoribosyltransferase regulatory subunit
MNDLLLKNEEKAVFALRQLYETYGYGQYKMSKFEEYDLYVRNKDFLISDSVITFTDTNGRLMALKPDVTLSIVKNSRDSHGVQKVYYNEHVYRVSKGTHAFREIMQTGLECIGDVDDYCLYEVVMLAAESLRCISPEWVLDISHLGVLSAVLDTLAISAAVKEDMLRCIGEKNAHELMGLCAANGVGEEPAALLARLLGLYGIPDEVLPELRKWLRPDLPDMHPQ